MVVACFIERPLALDSSLEPGWTLACAGSGTFEGRVPSILDGIVGASGKALGNFSPAVAQLLVCPYQCLIFFVGPIALFDGWVEVIVPPFSTLLAKATIELTRNVAPFLGSVFLD